MKTTAFLLCLALSFPLVACGGGGGNDNNDDNNTQELSAPPDGANSAYLVADPNGANVFIVTDNNTAVGTIPNASTPHREERAVYSFDISSLPSDAIITSAVLRIPQTGSNGDPFGGGVMAIVCVDHINLGAGVSILSYGQSALSVIVNPPFSNDLIVEDKVMEVSTQVQEDVDTSRSNSTFRLRGHGISPVHDAGVGTIDDVQFAGPSSNNPPSLVIQYTTPEAN